MDITTILRELEPCKVAVDVTIPAKLVAKESTKVQNKINRIAKIPGFRPGKIPKKLILKRYSQEIEAETVQELTSQALRQAMSKHNLEIQATPEVENYEKLTLKENEDLSFTFKLEVAPKFELPDYKNIKITVPKIEVKEEEIEKQIKLMLESNATNQKVDGPAQAGDMLKVTYKAELQDGELPEESINEYCKTILESEDNWLMLEEPTLIPNCLEQLIGSTAGETKTIEITFPEDFSEQVLASKKATYTIEIKEIRSKVYPELTDELAQEKKFKNAEELKQQIKKYLTHQKETARQQEIEAKINDYILSNTEITLPPTRTRQEHQITAQQHIDYAIRQGMHPDEAEKNKEQIIKNCKTIAENTLKRKYIFTAIATKENIEPTNEDINQTISYIAYSTQSDVKETQKRIIQAGNMPELIKDIVVNKTLRHLVELADISDEDAQNNTPEENTTNQ